MRRRRTSRRQVKCGGLFPEHWLVIIGYVGDTFVFWDSAGT
jgi:hypothetical protein